MLGIDGKVAMQKLVENLKAAGLPEVEQLAEKCLEAVEKTCIDVAAMPGVAPMAVLALPAAGKAIKGALMPSVNKIDGVEG